MDEDFEHIKPEDLPTYKKGKEIFEIIDQFCKLIPEDNEMLEHSKAQMYEDAALLSVKVAGAEAGDLYDFKMENATIIRKAASDLKVQNHALEMFRFEEVEYFNIVRDLLEEYRLLFIDCVAIFDSWNYIMDQWGLFSPPGIRPFEKDPDDS